MIRLLGSGLPAVATPQGPGAPAFRLQFGPHRHIPPFVRINPYALYPQPGFEVGLYSLGEPDFAGHYFRVPIGFEPSQMFQITSEGTHFQLTQTPLQVVPGQAWLDDFALNLYDDRTHSLTEGQAIVIEAIATTVLDEPDADYNYTLDLPAWGTFTALGLVCEGLVFQPANNPDRPQTGEFVQQDTHLKLYGSIAVQPAGLSAVAIHILWSGSVPTPSTSICTFDLTPSGIFHLDSISYLGLTFNPSRNTLAPLQGDFFWYKPRVTLFLDARFSLLPKRVVPAQTVKTLGTLTYQGVV